MLPKKPILLAATLLVAAGSPALAQSNSALLDLLVRKGILSEQEADDVRADLAKETAAATVSTAKGNYLEKVTLSGRVQAQAVALSTDINGTTADPADANHAFLRRIYVGVKAQLMGGWSTYVNYDFAGSTFDAAQLTWTVSDTFNIDLGLRKAPFGLEENFTSSGSLKAIERSPATRYFVEGNNGRRLGAASYRQGIWFNGNRPAGDYGQFQYSFAVTNAERDESSTGAAGTGNATNNNPAYWGHVAYAVKNTDGSSYRVGASVGLLPDQGGKTLGVGDDLAVYSVFGEGTWGKVSVIGEYLWSNNDNGAGPGLDANSSAYYLQPSYRFGNYEAVLRYTHVDSDGRGVSLSDGVRSAPSGGTMNQLTEWFLGANWYIRGNDTKVQAGYIIADTEDTIAGAPAKATTTGVRTQVQVNF